MRKVQGARLGFRVKGLGFRIFPGAYGFHGLYGFHGFIGLLVSGFHGLIDLLVFCYIARISGLFKIKQILLKNIQN